MAAHVGTGFAIIYESSTGGYNMEQNTSYFTRMGDGSGIYMSAEEIRRDIEEGVSDAMKQGKD